MFDLSLTPAHSEDISESLRSDQIVVVCEKAEAGSIEAVLAQVGFRNRIRGVITELDLSRWYSLACGAKYGNTLGKDLLAAIIQEMSLEFPLTQAKRAKRFLEERGYDVSKLKGTWVVRVAEREDSEED